MYLRSCCITILIPNQLFPQGIYTGSLSGTIVDSSGVIDVSNVASASFIYEAPFKDKGSGLLHRVLGGIQINGIYTYDSGNTATPYNYDYGYSNSGAGANFDNYCDSTFTRAFNSY